MIQVVALSTADRRLLCTRFRDHGNSHSRMLGALERAGAHDCGARLAALRRVEQQYDLDLAEICHRHDRRGDDGTHPIERFVLDFIAEERRVVDDTLLWIMPDRVRQVRDLMEGKLVGDLDS
jgi:hypothetical protein